jgi:hypothetical protein
MHLTQFLKITEAIPLAPRDFKSFTKKRIEDVAYIQSQLQEIHDKVEGLKKDKEIFDDSMYDINSAMRDVNDELDSDNLTAWGEMVYGGEEFRAGRALNLESLKGNLELTLLRTQEDDPDMRILATALDRYIESASNMEWLDLMDKLIDNKEQIYSAMEDRGLFDDDYPKQTKIAKTMLSIIDNLSNIETALKRIMASVERYQVILDKRASFFRGEHQYQPETEEVETLWHATAYAAEIAQSGFEAEGRGARRGVGTYGEFNGISFTHDLKIAHDISRSLKELTLIANGQVTRRHLLGWMEAEGIEPQKAASVYGQEVLTSDDPASVGNLYRVYLAYSPLRVDPVFANVPEVIEQLKGRKPQDVGIIQAEVNMRTPGIKHQTGESEWITPPEAVKSYKRLY